MSETLKLTQFCENFEEWFSGYQLTYFCDDDGNIFYVEIHSKNDIFSSIFLRILFNRLKEYFIFFTIDSTSRPIVQIIED